MKQILLIGAGHNFPKGPFTFLNNMNEQEKLHARALFFRPIDYAAIAAASIGANLTPIMELEDNEKEMIRAHQALFASQCEHHHIQYAINDNNRGWSKDLFVKESRFADLILISRELFCAESDDDQPNKYLREALHIAECPVLIVPEDYSGIQHLYMGYDGTKDSLYAIKQFCQLFPDLIDLPCEMIYAKYETANSIPDVEYIKQFTRLKFDCMGFSKLHFRPEDYFADWISEKKQPLLVTGSFGRSHLSYMAKRSFAENVIRDHNLTVFIAHH